MTRVNAALVLLLGLTGAAIAQPGAIEATAVQVGEPFPVLELPRLADGQPDSLANYRGQKVLLHVFASW